MSHGRHPRIITFYSYKGGTGRSMALANVAWILASNGRRVLAVDWDLEAPGLHRYFHPFLLDPELTSSSGVIDLVEDFVNAAVSPAGEDEPDRWYERYAEVREFAVGLRWTFPTPGRLDLLPAGRQGPAYAARVNAFDWRHFYTSLGGGVFLEAVRERMRRDYDYVLIDSRTGVSDTSGVCTVQMPDDLVVCFTANRQSVEGGAAVAASVRQGWASLGGDGPRRRIFPVFTRVELNEMKRLERAREYAQSAFGSFLDHLDASTHNEYWDRVEMLYYPYYAYEETLTVFGDRPGGSKSLLAATERLASYLTDGDINALVPPSETERQQVLAQIDFRSSGSAPTPARSPAASHGYRVFLSSTRQDLQDHRSRAIHALLQMGFTVHSMDEWTLKDQPALLGCDLFILLVAFRRGHVPEGQSLSVVQLEYQAARERGLDILVFLLGDEAPWPRRFDEMDRDAGIREWREQLRQRHPVQEFGFSPATLQVGPAVANWLARRLALKQAGERADDTTDPERRTPVLPAFAPAILASYNRLADVLDGVSRQLPHLWRDLTSQADRGGPDGSDEKEVPLLRRFRALRDLMGRQTCRIGCFGGSQVGKSRTLNNLLDVPAQERPALAGAGLPATTVPIRIRALPPGHAPTCDVCYLTPAEFEGRLALCDLFHLDPGKGLDEMCEELRGSAAQADVHVTDPARFLRFLLSYRAFGADHVRDPRRVEPVAYTRRHEVTNVPDGEQPSPFLLVREIAIGYPTAAIPGNVELIDLPGIDGRAGVAQAFLDLPSLLADLDGALLFTQAAEVASPGFEESARLLRSRFGNLAGRVWVVITGMDVVPKSAPDNAIGEAAFLDHCSRTMQQHGFPLDQVILIDNPLYEKNTAASAGALGEGRSRTGEPRWVETVAYARRRFGRKEESGPHLPPNTVTHRGALAEMYQKVLRDGGIGELREVIGQRLTAAIKERLCTEALAEVRHLADRTVELLQLYREKAGMNLEDVAAAVAWQAKVKALTVGIDLDRSLVEEPGRLLQARLRDRLRQVLPQPGQSYRQDELSQLHRGLTRVLARQAVQLARQETYPGIRANVRRALQLQAEQAGLRDILLPSGRGPLDSLEEEEKTGVAPPSDYATVLESLYKDELFPAGEVSEDEPFLSSLEYGRLLTRKLDLVVHEATQRMAHAVKARLRDLDRQLGLLGSDTLADTLQDDIDGLIRAAREV